MVNAAIVVGALLVALGGGTYWATEARSATAMIPAAFGLPLILLGIAGRKPAWRMHAMHLAAMIALLGLAGAAARPVRKLLGGQPVELNAAFYSQAATAVLCSAFVVLAVKSFVDARLRRMKAKTP